MIVVVDDAYGTVVATDVVGAVHTRRFSLPTWFFMLWKTGLVFLK